MDGNPYLIIGYRLKGEPQMQMYEGWSPFYEIKGKRYGELTICMVKCEGLALVIFARI